MDTVKTASGKEFEVSSVSVIPVPQNAYIRIINSNIADVAMVFGNPEETKEITYGEIKITGYRLQAFVMEGTTIRVNLMR